MEMFNSPFKDIFQSEIAALRIYGVDIIGDVVNGEVFQADWSCHDELCLEIPDDRALFVQYALTQHLKKLKNTASFAYFWAFMLFSGRCVTCKCQKCQRTSTSSPDIHFPNFRLPDRV